MTATIPRLRDGRTGWTALAITVVLAFVAAGVIVDAVSPAPQGPPLSSYATTPMGVAAWAQLLARAGHPVSRLRAPLAVARLDPAATLVLLGAGTAPAAGEARLRGFVRAGGTLVLGGPFTGGPPIQATSEPAVFTPPRGDHAAALLPGVRSVRTAGAGVFTGGGGAPLLSAAGGRTLLLGQTAGRGRVYELADPSPLENLLLGDGDNAQLGLDLAGSPSTRPVIFAEAIHGFGAATGLGAFPARWWAGIAGLALAAAAWVLARGRRLGGADPVGVAPPSPRTAYIGAMAGVLARAGDGGTLTEPARAGESRVPGQAVTSGDPRSTKEL